MLTVSAAYRRYFGAEHKPRTVEAYAHSARLFDGWAAEAECGPCDVTQVTNAHMLEFREALAGRGLRPTTINKHLRTLLAIFNRLGPVTASNPDGLGLIAVVPYAKRLKEPPPIVRVYELPQLERLLHACQIARWPRIAGLAAEEWWRAVISIYFNTGLRTSELFGLAPAEVDLQQRVLTVREAKGGEHQCVAINDACAQAIKVLMPYASTFLVPRPGTYKKRLHQWRKRLLRHAGISEIYTFHDLRRTFGSILFQENPALASKALRHSSIAVTEKHYVQITKEARALVDAMPQPRQPEADPPPEPPITPEPWPLRVFRNEAS